MHLPIGGQIRQTFRRRLAEVCSLVPCSHGSVKRIQSVAAVPSIPAALVPPTLRMQNVPPYCLSERVPVLAHRCRNTSTLPKSSDRSPKWGSLPRTGNRCSRLPLTLVPSFPALACQCEAHSVHVETQTLPLPSKSASSHSRRRQHSPRHTEYRNRLPQSFRVRANNRRETQNLSKLRNSRLISLFRGLICRRG